MECEVCGNEIYGKSYRTIIDGAKLFACYECAQYATGVWEIGSKKPGVTKKTPGYPMTKVTTFRRNIPSKLPEALDLVEGFGQRIRMGRMKLKLSHEDLSRKIGAKISVLRKLETEKMVPDQALAKRLEQCLKIKILQLPSEPSKLEEGFAKKDSELTLGDVVIIQKKGVET